MDGPLIDRLELPPMVRDNQASLGTAFTVSIEARRGVSTGISAKDRAVTVRAAIADDARPEDLVSPGHVFPLRARKGGVLVRTGQTEGSVDLARLAGLKAAGVICEIMRDDGEMARMPDLEKFAAEHNLLIVTIADLIEYRMSQELLVRRAGEARFGPHIAGLSREFQAYVYVTDVEDTEYLALVLGEPSPDEPVLVRVQTASVMRDVFGVSADPDVLPATVPLRMIEEEGKGILLYVLPRGRASLVDDFHESLAKPRPAGGATSGSNNRLRDFGLGAQVLAHLGVHKIRLLTNNPRRIVGVEGYGLHIVECVPIRAPVKVVPLRERGA
jgi:3,4-dihydroxy 2-butanone 4-phosphate synthase/GTP cyclohydrolase II